MKFNDIYEIARYFDEKQTDLVYPSRPDKPARSDYGNNARYGEAMDKWEVEREAWLAELKKYNELSRAINEEYKVEVLKFLGLTNHPKADKFWELAWDRGHSNGYNEIAIEAETLAELM